MVVFTCNACGESVKKGHVGKHVNICWSCQCLSCMDCGRDFCRVRLFVTPWTRACQALLSSTASWSWVKFMLVASMTLSNHLILCRPLLLLPSHFPDIKIFSKESSLLMTWPKYWSLSFRICPSSEHSRLISLRMVRFVLLAVQETLKTLLQQHNSKASVLRQSAFFMVQLSLPYITTGKTIPLTIRTFVGKVMFLLFKMLSRFVIAFLPRSRCLLISRLLSPSTMIMEPEKVKSVTASISSPSIYQEVMGPLAMILGFLMLSFRPFLALSSFMLIKKFFNSSSLSVIRVVSSAYMRLLIFIPAWNSINCPISNSNDCFLSYI
uniref:Cell growth-regulating nucleolar protein isoform X4 n=1 Tax=Pogona vitticeps TaxID=103695 RepID=A0ABM5GHK3_9SAUR